MLSIHVMEVRQSDTSDNLLIRNSISCIMKAKISNFLKSIRKLGIHFFLIKYIEMLFTVIKLMALNRTLNVE